MRLAAMVLLLSGLTTAVGCAQIKKLTPSKAEKAEVARADEIKKHPEWKEKKIVLLSDTEASDWQKAKDTIKAQQELLGMAEKAQDQLREDLIKAHGLDKYPARPRSNGDITWYSGSGGLITGSNVATTIQCDGNISIVDDANKEHAFIEYTPGGFSCWAFSSAVTEHNADVEDHRDDSTR